MTNNIKRVIIITSLMSLEILMSGNLSADNKEKTMDKRDIHSGNTIPKQSYCDQPYVVVNEDGSWTCVLTTGKKHEGSQGQHVVSTITKDKGKTWSPLVDIEPETGPEASWVVPLKTPYGRIYAFYTYNGDEVRTMPGKRKRIRADMLGWYCYKYSDDNGKTWSKQRYRIPVRITACDLANQWKGKVQIFWGIDKPKISSSGVRFAFTKLGKYMLDNGEGWMMHSDNILTEKDPEKINWKILPEGDHGLRHPDYGSIQEEHNMVPMSEKDFYCVYRTTKGFPAVTITRDAGKTWTKPTQMRYGPKKRIVRTPRACPKLWKCKNGKYLFWFHNNSFRDFYARNPVWIIGGEEKDATIHWSEPEILLYHNTPRGRGNIGRGMSYPDLIEQDGKYYVTETVKTVARVHEIDPTLLEGLWSQGKIKKVTTKGMHLSADNKKVKEGSVVLPELDLAKTSGMTIDFWLELDDIKEGQIIADTRDDQGKGFVVQTTKNGTVRIDLNDGKNKAGWDCDPGMIKGKKLQHVAIVIDNEPRIITFIVDGVLCDGDGKREFGWHKYKKPLGNVSGNGKLRLGKSLKTLRVYNRYLRTSEAVANFNAGVGK